MTSVGTPPSPERERRADGLGGREHPPFWVFPKLGFRLGAGGRPAQTAVDRRLAVDRAKQQHIELGRQQVRRMSVDRSAYGSTSGTDEREARPMMERLLVYSIRDEIEQLRQEDQWRNGDRNSRTLAKEVDFRLMLSVLRDGAVLHEEDGDARASLHILEGRATLLLDADEAELEAAEVAVVDSGHRWQLRASGDCAVLLTLAWPREKAGI